MRETILRQRPAWLGQRMAVVLGLAGALCLAWPHVALAGVPGPSSTIRVRVNNYTQAPDGLLAAAEREASQIFAAAGLAVDWLTCPTGHANAFQQDACNEAPEATDIILRILSAPARSEFQDTVFGFAVHPLLASVYYDRVLLRAINDDAKFEIHFLLGCVIAHEIGHLLIGSNSHSNLGVMQAHWDRKQIRQAVTGTLLFTSEQVRLIQAGTQTRIKLRTAVAKERASGMTGR